MGRVWKARDEVLHRDVAIKELVPPPGLTSDERREMRERSLREARAIARLNNINVVRIFDVLRTDGDPWIVMEYVASKSLQDTIAEDGPVSPARAVEIGLGVLNALKAAHKAGIMHRDVKPGNVLLGTDGRVVLTDFGLATIPGDPNVTRTGMVLGSPAYIAPERPATHLRPGGRPVVARCHPVRRRRGQVSVRAPVRDQHSGRAGHRAGAAGPQRRPAQAGARRAAAQGPRGADHRRVGRTHSLLDGVRRPGPNGPREPRPPLVPAPRPSGERPSTPVTPPAPRTPPTSGLLAGGAEALVPQRTVRQVTSPARTRPDDEGRRFGRPRRRRFDDTGRRPGERRHCRPDGQAFAEQAIGSRADRRRSGRLGAPAASDRLAAATGTSPWPPLPAPRRRQAGGPEVVPLRSSLARSERREPDRL